MRYYEIVERNYTGSLPRKMRTSLVEMSPTTSPFFMGLLRNQHCFLLQVMTASSVAMKNKGRIRNDGNSGMTTGYSKVYPWLVLLIEVPALS